MLGSTNYAEAALLLRQFVQQQPHSAEGHFLLAFALLRQEKAQASLDEYAQGAKLRAWSAEEWIGVASDELLLKNNAEAERSLIAASKLAPQRPLVWYLLGRSQYNQNHTADAETSLLTCLRLDANHARAEYILGLVYESLQRPESAEAAYRAAIALEETSSTKEIAPYLSLGILLRKQGKLADALPLLTTAASTPVGSSFAHQELGLAEEQAGHYEKALEEMKYAVLLNPQRPELHFFLGRLSRLTGHQNEAAVQFAEAARLADAQKYGSMSPSAVLR